MLLQKNIFLTLKVVLSNRKKAEVYSNTLDDTSVFNMNLLADHYELKAESEGYYAKSSL